MPDVQSLLSNVSGQFPIDLVVLVIFAVVVTVDALRNGTRRAAVFSLAAPLAFLIFAAVPNAAFLGSALAQLTTMGMKAALFGMIFICTFILVYRIVPASFGSGTFPLQGLVGGLAAAAILAVVWLQIPALVSLWTPSPMIQTIFGPAYRVFWLLGAYVALAFVRR